MRTNYERIIVDNGQRYVEGNLLSIEDFSSKEEGFLIANIDKFDTVMFFPSAYVLRYWFKGKWVYMSKVKANSNSDYYKIYS